jgi:hypothetical protein
MRRITAATLAFATLLAWPALAEPVKNAPAKIKPEDITRQETVALGDNRFLIFSGTAGQEKHYGYTVDLVKIEDGIPRFDPLFMEEYDLDRNAARLEYGVAFMALSYRFDRNDGTFDYTVVDAEDQSRYQYKYKLDVDIFKLQEVITQAKAECAKEPCKPPPPKVVFNVKDVAEKAAMMPAAAPENTVEKAVEKPAVTVIEDKPEAKATESKPSRPFSIVPITHADMQTDKDAQTR